MLLISSSVSLIAIVAGMFLYAKTIKDGLNRFFKFVAFFIIIIGFFNFLLAGAFFSVSSIYKYGAHHSKMKMKCHGHHGNKMKKQCSKYMSCYDDNCEDMMMCGHGMMEEHGMMKGHGMDGKYCCSAMMETMHGKSMMHGTSSCLEGDMMVKKDSVKINR